MEPGMVYSFNDEKTPTTFYNIYFYVPSPCAYTSTIEALESAQWHCF